MEKKMKKFTVLFLSVMLIFGLTFSGCDIAKDLISKFTGTTDTTDTPTPETPTTPTTPSTPTPTTPKTYNQSGYLNGPGDSYTFSLDAGTVRFVEVPFTYPEGSVDFWVKVVGKDGTTVLGDFDLDNGEIIQLKGGDVFFLTIYSKGGAGYWSTKYTIGGGSSATCNSTSNTANGYLPGPGETCTFLVYSSGYVEVPFTYPEGSVKFWVKVESNDTGDVLGNFDLDNGSVIQLSGEGYFRLTISSTSGAGSWSANW